MATPKKGAPMGWRGLPQRRPARPSEASRKQSANMVRQRGLRSGMVMAFVTALTLVLGYRLVYWQVVMRDELLTRAEQPTLAAPTVPPRGTIRDRNGYLLATDQISYRFSVSPNILSYPERTAEEVNAITGIPHVELLEVFGRDSQNEVISSTLPFTMGQELAALEHRFFRLEPVLTRAYPNGPLGSHLLGFVNAERRGLAGVEMFYDGLLTGTETRAVPEGPPAEEIKLGHRPFMPTASGVDLILTMDRSVQFIIEQELERAVSEYEALGGTIIVMEPGTGDILGMASTPGYDPNRYGEYLETPEVFQNPAVSQQYEPGSVFKIITVAGVLDAGLVTPNTVWNDPGVFEVGGRVITNWDGRAYGPRTVTEILGFSLNTGTAYLNTLLGAERFYHYVDAFGFGEPTGVDLGSEAAGMVKHPPGMLPDPNAPLWHPSDLGTNAFGQGIAVTPLQMISSVASLLNDGQVMQPRVVRSVINHGHLEEVAPVVRSQSVAPETAWAMQSLMADAVQMETETALIEGWRVGGKTGTAQVAIPGGYHPTDTIASFIGYAPADDPAFIVLVKLNRPLGIFQWGSQSAAPTFHRITSRLLTYFNIAPDQFRAAAASTPVTVSVEQAAPVGE